METVLRVAVIYAVLLAAFRVLGKRELSSLSSFELVTLLLVPEILSEALTTKDYSLTNGLAGALTVLTLVFVTSLLSHRFPRVRHLLEADPTVLVREGRLIDRNLDRERVHPTELFGEMRKAGIERVEEVRWAILEGDGRISFIRMDAAQPQQTDDEEDALT